MFRSPGVCYIADLFHTFYCTLAAGAEGYRYFPSYTAVSGKVVLKKRKAYATIPKGSLGID